MAAMGKHASGKRTGTTPSARVHRAHEVAEWIRENVILPGRPGRLLPSERYLQAQTGAARKTVRKALAILREEGWLRQLPRRGRVISRPRRRLLHTAGLYFPGTPIEVLTLPFYRELWLGIRQGVRQLGRQVFELYGFRRGPESMERSVFWSPNLRLIDSLLLVEVYDQQLIRQAGQLYPTVCLDVSSDAPNVSSVCFDHVASICMAYKFLLDRGHRRIGLVTQTEGADPAVAERLTGFEESLRWIDAAEKSQWLYPRQMDPDPDVCLRPWLETPPDRRPTALVVVDAFWPCVLHLRKVGVRVPADVHVVGVGSHQQWSGWASELDLQPELDDVAGAMPATQLSHQEHAESDLIGLRPTTVHLPAREMGRWSVREIHRRLRDPSALPRHQMLPPRLIEGTSTSRLP